MTRIGQRSSCSMFDINDEPCNCSSCLIGFSTSFSHLLHNYKMHWTQERIIPYLHTSLKTMGVESKILLSRNVSTSDLGIILRSFSHHRFNGGNIRNYPGLMNSLKRSDSSRAVLLVQYGFPYLFDKDYFKCRFWRLQQVIVHPRSLGNQISNSILDSRSLRLQMALDILMVLFGDVLQLKHAMSLIWRAVPFPYISSKEMFTLLKPFYNENHIPLKVVCKEYRERNPLFEVPDDTQPRSLQHLSRVQVRKNMCDASSIGDDTINSLDIPSVIKDYLKLQQ